MEKKWVISEPKIKEEEAVSLVDKILIGRGFATASEREAFLNPISPEKISLATVGLEKEISAAAEKIKEAISKNLPIIIHGDYDVDGICGTAILWEAIYKNLGYKKCLPYIPDRFSEGYGLSKASVEGVAKTKEQIDPAAKKALLITVDCGISAFEEIRYARSLGFGVIIVDHHQKKESLPKADVIVWTDRLCAAGMAWFTARCLCTGVACNAPTRANGSDLASLATIADLQPLSNVNRSLVKFGLEEINHSKRIGLLELADVAGLTNKKIGTYEVGWMLAPRLNAAGRLESALFSLRLLCTENVALAREIARTLNQINSERQRLTEESIKRAREEVGKSAERVLIVSHESYHEGVIGLVAGKLAQNFYRPAVAISVGNQYSKGSARSIAEFNIIEAIRTCEDLLVDAGGHPMAAGFTIETTKISEFTRRLVDYGTKTLPADLSPTLKVDLEINPFDITWEFWEDLKKMEPFGVGNREPLFLIHDLEILNLQIVGAYGNHLKLLLSDGKKSIVGMGFGLGNLGNALKVGDKIDLVASVTENIWNGNRSLELQIKDSRKS